MSTSYEERQEQLQAELKQIEKFKSKYERVVETPFTSPEHVAELVDTATVRLGSLNHDWFVRTSNGWSTGDIIRHNADAEESDKIRQYLYIGIPSHVPEQDYEDFKYDVDVMKLENLTL